jgi:hypothetical protein
MAVKSSYHTIAEQIINYNNNAVDLLSRITQLISSNDSTVNLNLTDQSGIAQQFVLPSFGYLKNEIDRLNNNLNSIYSINDGGGTFIQPSNGTKFRKIVTVDLNREPSDLSALGLVNTFSSRKNWFFDSMLNPELTVELDLTNKIENNVRKVLCRRYIPEFAQDQTGALTPLGQSALNSFNTLFLNRDSFTLDEYLNWHENTPGLVEPLNPNYDEQMFDLEPNFLRLDGFFSVYTPIEDTLNRKLYYPVNKLSYVSYTMVGDEMVSTQEKLGVNSELIINTQISTTRYKIVEISEAFDLPRLRLERVEGIEPIPIGVNTLKIYSPVTYNKIVKISIGYNERNVLFLKAMNMDNYIMSRNWSTGVGFFTSNLRESNNQISLEQYYTDSVFDYGTLLKDLVAKKTPNSKAGTPTPPTLLPTNFKVVQINQHLTNTTDTDQLKKLHTQQKSLKSEVRQLEESVSYRNREMRLTDFKNDAEVKKLNLTLKDTITKKESKSKLLASVNTQLLDLSRNINNIKAEPKFRIRGFWDIPEAVLTRGTFPQEVIQFRVQYRYLSRDSREPNIESFKISRPVTAQTRTAAFSNWVEMKTDVRKRTYDKSRNQYFWQIEDVSNAETPNINQLDIPIQPNEKVEVRISSISEVGWPESPVESEFSETITIEFPDSLNGVVNENDFILKEADKEDLLVTVNSDLTARGLDDHLTDQITINGVTYFHSADKVLSGVKDENGLPLGLFDYLQRLENRIRTLEERINRTRGILEVSIYRNDSEFKVTNGQNVVFTVELEDYLDTYSATDAPTGRVYKNDIYVIKDFVMKVRNLSFDSPLGLLSNRSYNPLTNSDVYNSSAPQVFWVDQQNQLLASNSSGTTKTQLDNQFIWSVNYDKVNQNSVIKLGQNIANNFTEQADIVTGTEDAAVSEYPNSVVDILSSESFNLGYSEDEILSFVGNNLSLFDSTKWIENTTPTVASLNKLLTSIHPQIPNLEQIQETNSAKIKSINGGTENEISIPLNIYFKMNSVDPNQVESNYHFIDLNGNNVYTSHIKKLKFLLENESENRPFIFTIQFTLNRAKTILRKSVANSPVTSTQ